MPETSDRRTLYTRAVIKDAFLALIASGGWRRLSVTLLCKKAGIARATFYLHYANLDEVLDDVLRDAFQVGDGDIRRVLRQLRQTMKAGTLTADAFLPLCQRAADSPRYRPLLLDENLPGRILSFLYDTARADVVPSSWKAPPHAAGSGPALPLRPSGQLRGQRGAPVGKERDLVRHAGSHPPLQDGRPRGAAKEEIILYSIKKPAP